MRTILCLVALGLMIPLLQACESQAADSKVKAADTQPANPLNTVTDPTKVPGPDTHNTMR